MATKTKKMAKATKKATDRAVAAKAARDVERKAAVTKPGSRLAKELAVLGTMTKAKLWVRYEEVFGHKTKSCNTNHLRTAIAQRLHEQAATKTKPKRADGESNASSKPSPRAERERDPRLPPVGSVLEKEHKGTTHKVNVLDDGFEYAGEKHRSLSGIAKAITGSTWNGLLWFGLVKRPAANGKVAGSGA